MKFVMSQDNYSRIPPSQRPWLRLAHVTQQLLQSHGISRLMLCLWLSSLFQTLLLLKNLPGSFPFFIISFKYTVQCNFMELLVVNRDSGENQLVQKIQACKYFKLYISSGRSKKTQQYRPTPKDGYMFMLPVLQQRSSWQNQALPKGIIQTLCKGFPRADRTRLSTEKAGAGESIQIQRGKCVRVTNRALAELCSGPGFLFSRQHPTDKACRYSYHKQQHHLLVKADTDIVQVHLPHTLCWV